MATVLLFAQALSASHLDLEEAHSAGEVCAVCVVHAQMGSGSVAAAPVFAFAAQQAEVVEFLSAVSVHQRVSRVFARGPPQVS